MKKDIIGYEGHYEIYDDGRVYSLKTDTYLRPAIQNSGYHHVSLWKEGKGTSFTIHRMLATHFIPNPNALPEAHHKDGNKDNNCVSNIEWSSCSDNSQHAVDTGLRVYTNRLTRDEFLNCLNAVLEGETYKALSERVPYKVPFLSVKLRKIAREEGKEEELNNALKAQKAARALKNLDKINK